MIAVHVTPEHVHEDCLTYHREVALVCLDTPPGPEREMRLAEVLRRREALYQGSTCTMLQTQIAEAPSASRQALQRLWAWSVTMATRIALLPTQHEIQERLRTSTCIVDAESIPLWASFAAMASEKRRDRRAAIEAAVTAQLDDTMNELYRRQFESLKHLASQVHYTSLNTLLADMMGLDLAAQYDMVVQVLKETEEVYVDLLTWAAKRQLRLPPGQLQRHDIFALFTFEEYQRYYQPGMLVPHVRAWLHDMGIDPRADGRLTWRHQAAPAGPPAALALHIPDEIVLSYGTTSGIKESAALASECGRALLWGYTASDLPLLDRCLGNTAIAAGSAEWLAQVIAHPLWLRHYAAVYVDGNYRSWRRLDTLYRLRRQLGRFLYTYHLYTTDSLAGASEAYRDIMMDTCRVDYPSAYFLLDLDHFYDSLSLWRSWHLAYALLEALEQQYGGEWFRFPASGEWLKHFWASALGKPLDDLLHEVLGRPWEVSCFVETLLDERL